MTQKYISYDDNNTASKYFKDIKKIDLDFKSKYKTNSLSLEEEIKLAKRILEKDQKAIDELVKANLRFVISIAKPYQNCGLSLNDLINEGNIGLIKAATKFDYTKGFRFISYAVWWIKQSILFSLNENSRTIRLPTSIINRIHGLKSLIDKFHMENEREPTYGDIVDINNEFVELLHFPKPASLSDPIGKNEEHELGDIIIDKESEADDNKFIIDENVKKELNNTLALLTDREREIIECYFGLNGQQEMILDVIGERFDLTKERVRQIKKHAIKKMKINSTNLFKVLNS